MDDFEREGLLTCLFFFWKSIPCGTNIAIKSVFFDPALGLYERDM